MRCLKIEDNKGWYTVNNTEWITIDKISRDDLLMLLDICIKDDEFQMDEYNEDKLANQAHRIIYSNIYAKFLELLRNKTKFKDESELLYREAIEKYS